MIGYHMSWPGADPYYNYNSGEADARRSYYGVNGIPTIRIDGSNPGGSYSTWGNAILARADVPSEITIDILGNLDYGTLTANISVIVGAEATISGDFILHCVLVEDGLYYMGSNGNPDHENVMRDMIPSSAGTSIELVAGENTTVELEFDVPNPIIPENAHVIVFVQNPTTKEVLNAADVFITDMGPINVPNLTFDSVELNIESDDGDNKLNPGEGASMAVMINNACDWADANDVVGLLSSGSPFVTISEDGAEFGLIVNCDYIANDSDPFHFSVSAEAPAITELPFTLILSANQDTEDPYETVISFTVPMDMYQAHYPIELAQPVTGGNAVVDLNGTGGKEVVVAGSDSLVHVFNHLGFELPGFPVFVGNKVQGSVAIGDLENDGDLEIVVGSRDKKLYVIQHDGSVADIAEAESYILSTPTLADLDLDGDLEIVATGFGYDVLAVHHDGTPFGPFPITLEGERMSRGAAVVNLGGDENPEIIVATWGDQLHAFGIDGSEYPGFPVALGDKAASAVSVADLDQDLAYEILVGSDDDKLYAIDTDGTVIWAVDHGSGNVRTSAAPFIGPEDVTGVAYSSVDAKLFVVDAQGDLLPGWPVDIGSSSDSSPIVEDIDGDGIPEVFVGSNNGNLYGFALDGTSLENFPILNSSAVDGIPTIADIDMDGNPEVVVGTDEGLVAIDLKSEFAAPQGWFTDRGDYHRSGVFPMSWLDVDESAGQPANFTVLPSYPNPFNPVTHIRYALPAADVVTVSIHDMLGREVASLMSARQQAGWHQLSWDGTTSAGSAATGIYYARITSAEHQHVLKLVLMK